MIEITKKERDYLQQNKCYWHYDIMTTVHKRHYYARDCEKVRKLLEKFRAKGE